MNDRIKATGRRLWTSARFFCRMMTDFIYPPLCLLCDGYLSRDEHLIHAACLARLPLLDEEALGGDALYEALRFTPCFDLSIALYPYGDEAQKLIHFFKYGGLWSLSRPLGQNLGQLLIDLAYHRQIDALIPVPLHKNRRRQRGYNQAEKLALEAGRISGIAVWRDVLDRKRPTPPQARMNRSERRRNLSGAFTVVDPETVSQKTLAIVDDVLTTGSTLDECARILSQAGAARIIAVSLARVV